MNTERWVKLSVIICLLSHHIVIPERLGKSQTLYWDHKLDKIKLIKTQAAELKKLNTHTEQTHNPRCHGDVSTKPHFPFVQNFSISKTSGPDKHRLNDHFMWIIKSGCLNE